MRTTMPRKMALKCRAGLRRGRTEPQLSGFVETVRNGGYAFCAGVMTAPPGIKS
jgi:hypothetical protein